MLYQLRKISMEQCFLITAFTMSIILSFLMGYAVFRYTQMELCKPLLEIANFGAK